MDVARFEKDVERLQTKALSRLDEAHTIAVERLREEFKFLRDSAERNTAYIAPNAAPEVVVPKALLPHDISNDFCKMFFEPPIPVKVNGRVFHVHQFILRSVPYFAAMLDGPWRDSSKPEVDLPCSIDEFGHLLRRLYTNEPLGSTNTPSLQSDTVVRLAVTCSMLLLDDRFPELPSLLRSSIRNPEDVEMASKAIGALSPSLASALDGLQTGLKPIPDATVSQMIRNAGTREAREMVSAILERQRGQIDKSLMKDALVDAMSRGIMIDTDPDKITWCANLANEHLQCVEASSIFKLKFEARESCCHSCPHFCDKSEEVFVKEFIAHSLRCAKTGCAADLLADIINYEMSNSSCSACLLHGLTQKPATYQRISMARICKEDPHFLADLLRVAWHERPSLANLLASISARELADILTDDLLVSLGNYVEPVIAKLVSNANSVVRWVTAPRLALLSKACRWQVCVVLAAELDRLDADIDVVVVQELCGK